MESNEGNKLTKWRQTHGYREQTDEGGLGSGEGIKQRKKGKAHGHRQQNSDCQREGGGER